MERFQNLLNIWTIIVVIFICFSVAYVIYKSNSNDLQKLICDIEFPNSGYTFIRTYGFGNTLIDSAVCCKSNSINGIFGRVEKCSDYFSLSKYSRE